MSKFAVKHGTSFTSYNPTAVAGGIIVDRPAPQHKESFAGLSGGLKGALNKASDMTEFSVTVKCSVPDVHGLREHGKETDGFTTKRLVTHKANLKFADVPTASTAFNYLLERMSDNDLKDALENENLADKIAEACGLEIAPAEDLFPTKPWEKDHSDINFHFPSWPQ